MAGPSALVLFGVTGDLARKKLLPAAPSAVNVLWRSLVAHQRYDMLPAAPHDHPSPEPYRNAPC